MYVDDGSCSFDSNNLAAMDMELQQQVGFSMDMNSTTQLVPFDPPPHHHQQQQPNWDNQDMTYNNNIQQEPAADLLNLFHLPRCSPSSSSITFPNPNFPSTSLAFLGDVPMGMDASLSSSSSVLYDPLLHLSFPPQPPPLFQPPPNMSLFISNGEDIDGEASQDGADQVMQFENGILEFTRDRARGGRRNKPFTSERHRREQMSGKYQLLRALVPNPTKVIFYILILLHIMVKQYSILTTVEFSFPLVYCLFFWYNYITLIWKLLIFVLHFMIKRMIERQWWEMP